MGTFKILFQLFEVLSEMSFFFNREGTFSGISLKDQAAQFYQKDSLENTEGVYKNF